MGLFMSAIPISGVLGSPLSGWMMEAFSGHGGLAGWQWMFLLQGIPTVVLGLLAYALLNDGVGKAKWLTDEQKTQLNEELAEDERQRRHHSAQRHACYERGNNNQLRIIKHERSLGGKCRQGKRAFPAVYR